MDARVLCVVLLLGCIKPIFLYKCPEEHRFQAAGNERKKERILIERMKERKKERKRERKKERREKERKKNPGKLPGRSTTSF